MKPFPWKCGECRERAVSPVELPTYKVEAEHDGRSYAFTVNNLEVLRCERCGEMMLEDAANQKISDALRREVGLLLPLQIRQERERLGLTQKQVAAFLRISESTLSRWETGAQLQQRSMDGLLRLFFDLEEVRIYLGFIDGSHSDDAVLASTPAPHPTVPEVKDMVPGMYWDPMSDFPEAQAVPPGPESFPEPGSHVRLAA